MRKTSRKKHHVRGGRLVADPAHALSEAIETGCGFAINRLEDYGWTYRGKDAQAARQRAVDAMSNELAVAIYERFRVEG